MWILRAHYSCSNGRLDSAVWAVLELPDAGPVLVVSAHPPGNPAIATPRLRAIFDFVREKSWVKTSPGMWNYTRVEMLRL